MMPTSTHVTRREGSAVGGLPHLTERATVVAGLFLATGVLLRWAGSDDPDAAVGGNPVNEAIWAAYYVGALLGILAETRAVRRLLIPGAPLAAMAGLALLSVLWSDSPVLTLRRGVALAGTTTLAFYVVARFPLRDFLRMLAGAFGAVAVLSLIVIVMAPSVGLEQHEYAGAWRGILGNKNGLGQTMAFGVVTCVVFASEERGWGRALAASLAILCGILVVGSRSVGSLLVAAVGVSLSALFLGFRTSQRQGLAVLAVFYVVATAVAALVLFGVGLDGAIEALGRSPDLTGRMQLWPLVIDAIADRPVLGHGYAAFWSTHGGLADYIEFSLGFRPFYAHNGFLDLALDTGLVGVLLFLVVLLTGFVRALFAANRIHSAAAVWPLATMATFLAANVVESNIAQYNELNWVLFCVAFLYSAFIWRIAPPRRRAPVLRHAREPVT